MTKAGTSTPRCDRLWQLAASPSCPASGSHDVTTTRCRAGCVFQVASNLAIVSTSSSLIGNIEVATPIAFNRWANV